MTSHNIKLIIFDFDGVLRDASWRYLYDAYKVLIETAGKDPDSFFTDVDSFRKWTNMDWHKNEERIFGGAYVPNPEFDKKFHAAYDPNIKLFPWVSDTLAQLSQKYALAMLSSSSKASIEKELGELSRYFSFVLGAEDVVRLKPDPEGVQKIVKLTGAKESETLMIGDMSVDFLAGSGAGAKTGLVKWGLGDWEDLLALKPDFLFEEPGELLRL
ncbi:MAG: HAD-IA family hydrolase [Candidatus Paceibacterota bacterium]|jgi:HAD superfamily hydrolase (TIGR01509 family)|nr:HAD-IA family hydrolase [Candidatus Paceibacterota bacterium]